MKLNHIGSNQTELTIEKNGIQYIILFSYNTPVACQIYHEGLTVYKKTEKKHSVTTSKHINKWLGDIRAEEKPQEFFNNLVE